MRKKGYKGRCEKRTLAKCEGVCCTYDAIQAALLSISCRVSVAIRIDMTLFSGLRGINFAIWKSGNGQIKDFVIK